MSSRPFSIPYRIWLAWFLALVLGGVIVWLHESAPRDCAAERQEAAEHLEAVAACANAPGCQFSSESIRVALTMKNRAEACK